MRRERDASACRLARCLTYGGCLNPMIHCIAQHMHHRVAEFIDQLPVKLNFRAAHDTFHILSDRVREFSHHASNRVEHDGQRQHAHDQCLVVQLVHEQFLGKHIIAQQQRKVMQTGLQ